MKTTTIYEQVFLHHQCARRKSRCYKISLFQRYLSFCTHEERHIITLVVFFLIINSDNSLFFSNNDAFLLVFGIKNVKYLCNSCSENSWLIFMTHISLVNDCKLIIIDLNTLWVLHPLTFKNRYL
jgi:hypothetical protein